MLSVLKMTASHFGEIHRKESGEDETGAKCLCQAKPV